MLDNRAGYENESSKSVLWMSARNIENRFPLPNQQQRLKEDKDMRYM